jgi:hypothetical protein
VRPRRVLFVLKWRVVPYDGHSWGWMDPGTPSDPSAKLLSHGLNNSCRFVVDMLNASGVEAKLVQVSDDNDIWKEIVAYEPSLVVIEAYWMRPKKLGDLEARFPGLPIVVRGHSSTPFLAEDSIGFPWAVGYLAAGGIVGQNDQRHVNEMRFLAEDLFGLDQTQGAHHVPYLPNYYPVSGPVRVKEAIPGEIDVGCFGAIRSLKNHVGQAIAAMMFARGIERRLRFHINGDRLERGGQAVSAALDALFDAAPDAELIRHPWIPTHEEFLALVASMDLVTQISFAETFNIVAADAASQGVPVVGSAEIPWLAHASVANPTDTKDMARVMRHAWDTRFVNQMFDSNRAGLEQFSAASKRAWLRFLEEELG